MNDRPGESRPQKRDYRKLMDGQIASLSGTPRLLLHSCCAPCSTAVISALAPFFEITVLYYNPNIDDRDEYERRKAEQKRLLALIPQPNPVSFTEGSYDPEDFLSFARGFASEPEGGERCALCYALRLDMAARTAREGDFGYFSTTLSVSPMKDAERINSIGSEMGTRYGVAWLWSDFKKKDGYRRSIELSKEYGLYRQNYCGCSFSKRAEAAAQTSGFEGSERV